MLALAFAQKLIIMRRSSELVQNRLRQQAGNPREKTRSLARPVPYRVRLIEFLGKAWQSHDVTGLAPGRK